MNAKTISIRLLSFSLLLSCQSDISTPVSDPLAQPQASETADLASMSPEQTDDKPIGVRSISQSEIDSLSEMILSEMKTQNIPGLAVALVKPERVLWQAGFGQADLATGRKVEADTPFIIASISKAVTYVNLLQLYDQGQIDLDTDINQYLSFPVRNPNFPEQKITARMLMTHMSSIKDSGVDVYTRGADTPIQLADFVQDYFTPGAPYYSEQDNFYAQAPGSENQYSNMGTALAGYLVEAISQKPFYEFSRENLLGPLGMSHSSWLLKNADLSQLATPYGETNEPLLHYTFPDYPNGQLRSSVSDMSHFLRMLINGGRFQTQMLLSAETVAEMRKVQTPEGQAEYGLGLTYDEKIPGTDRRLFGHSGSEQGTESVMYYDTQSQTGVILLMNKQDISTSTLMKTLFEIGDRY